MRPEIPPAGLGHARGGHGRFDVLDSTLADLGDGLGCRRVRRLERHTHSRVGPVAPDEVPEGSTVFIEPLVGELGAFRGRTVFERLEDFGDLAHASGCRCGAE